MPRHVAAVSLVGLSQTQTATSVTPAVRHGRDEQDEARRDAEAWLGSRRQTSPWDPAYPRQRGLNTYGSREMPGSVLWSRSIAQIDSSLIPFDSANARSSWSSSRGAYADAWTLSRSYTKTYPAPPRRAHARVERLACRCDQAERLPA